MPTSRFMHLEATLWSIGVGEPGLVSIIVPCFNAEAFVDEALQSCVEQTYRPIEVIIVDDGCTDNTHAIGKKFLDEHNSEDCRIRIYRQENQGLPAARNVGILKSKGAHLCFLDADDVYPRYRIQVLIDMLRRYKASVAYGRRAEFSDEGELVELAREQHRSAYPGVDIVSPKPVAKFVPGLGTALICRNLIAETGPFKEELLSNQDREWVPRMRAQTPSMVRTQSVTQFWRKNPKSITHTHNPEKAHHKMLAVKFVWEYMKERSLMDDDETRILSAKVRQALSWAVHYDQQSVAVECCELQRDLEKPPRAFLRTALGACLGSCLIFKVFGTLVRLRNKIKRRTVQVSRFIKVGLIC